LFETMGALRRRRFSLQEEEEGGGGGGGGEALFAIGKALLYTGFCSWKSM